jgi:hypothetical protein
MKIDVLEDGSNMFLRNISMYQTTYNFSSYLQTATFLALFGTRDEIWQGGEGAERFRVMEADCDIRPYLTLTRDVRIRESLSNSYARVLSA